MQDFGETIRIFDDVNYKACDFLGHVQIFR